MVESSEPAWQADPVEIPDGAPSRRRPSRKRRTAAEPSRASRRRLRILYFTLASLWGFLAGSVCILGGLSLRDEELPVDGWIVGVLAVAAVLAVVGGGVVATAYRDASRRRFR